VVFGANQSPRARQRRQQAAAFAEVAPRHDVLEGAHVEEDLQVLERAPDAGRGERVRRQAGQFASVERDAAGARHVDAGEQVEQRGLAGAVRADDRVNRARVDRKRQSLHRVDAAEFPGEPVDAQSAHRGLRPSQSPMVGTAPRGKKIIVAIMIAPSTTISYSLTTVRACGRTVSTAAPTTAPKVDAMPPKTTIVTSSTECMNDALAGVMKPL